MKSYLTITLRTLKRDKVYTAINIVGLALGISCFIILVLYLQHDLSYDLQHSKYERIYRVDHETDYANTRRLNAGSSDLLGLLLSRDYPKVESHVTFRKLPNQRTLFKQGEKSFYEEKVYIADNSVFNIFDFNVISGDPYTALNEPYAIAISESFAQRYFGAENPLNKTVSTNQLDFKVSLVYEDLADNSHLKYDALIANAGDFRLSDEVIQNGRGRLWSFNAFTYVLLHPEYANLGFHESFEDFFDRMMADVTRPGGYHARFYLEPLSDIHLYSKTVSDLPRGNLLYLYAFSAVALFVLLIACINYINLATARATKRTREISMRKVLGASRTALIRQFMGESMAFSLLALIVAVGLVKLLLNLDVTQTLFGKQMSFDLFGSGYTLLSLLLFGLAIGLLSGLYPALYLSASRTGATVKNTSGAFTSITREVLILLQFTVSIAVISSTFLMYLQMIYVSSESLGFAKENRLSLNAYTADAIDKLPTFIEEMKRNPNIIDASIVSSAPWKNPGRPAVEIPTDSGATYNMNVAVTRVDEDFIGTMGMKLTAGRNFDKDRDSQPVDRMINVLVNEAFVRAANWIDPIGQVYGMARSRFMVIGVVEDFHFEDFHQQISPFVFYFDRRDFSNANSQVRDRQRREVIFNVSGRELPATMDLLQEKWQEFAPDRPWEFEFLDDTLNEMYASDQQQMQLIGLFSSICIIISCLGLFGLTAFSTELRSKEIGIRKTLGATTLQLILLLFRRVFFIVSLGALLAIAISLWGIELWLQGFYYRGEINLWVFPVAAISAMLVAFMTVALQSGKTAAANPIKSLRYE